MLQRGEEVAGQSQLPIYAAVLDTHDSRLQETHPLVRPDYRFSIRIIWKVAKFDRIDLKVLPVVPLSD